MKNILTIDLEDWYHGIEIDHCHWSAYESRIEWSAGLVLDILAEAGVKATFFILSYVAECSPQLIRMIKISGHEIATHGYSHTFIYKQNPSEFASELKHSLQILEDIAGDKIIGHRAPYFSITKDSYWALDILADQGLKYDSSIFPVDNYRYGIPDAPRKPHLIKTKSGELTEFPISTIRYLGRNIPMIGGSYFRIFPYQFIKWGINKINKEGQAAIIYLHPWELDPEHPRLDSLPLRIKLPHYYNLKCTERKLKALLRDFKFGSISDQL